MIYWIRSAITDITTAAAAAAATAAATANVIKYRYSRVAPLIFCQ